MNSKDQQTRKKKIEKAALDLFSSQGFHAVSVDRIVERAGVSKGLFYFHFKNKPELLKKMLYEALDELWRGTYHEMDESQPPLSCLQRTVESYFGNLKKNEKQYRLLLSLMLTTPDLFEKRIAATMSSYIELYDYFHWLFARLGYAHPGQEVRLLSNILYGMEMRYFTHHDNREVELRLSIGYLLQRYSEPAH